MRRLGSGAEDEAGFTLVELLAVIAILGVITFALTEAVIIGLKTTDSTANDLSRSVAVQALQSYFTPDVQSAKLVSKDDPAPTCAPPASAPDVFLHLSWTEQLRARDVSYALEPDGSASSGQSEIVRWSCIADGPPNKRMLGHLSFDPAGPKPVVALCDGADCRGTSGPATVTLTILTNRAQDPAAAVDLTVRRRTT